MESWAIFQTDIISSGASVCQQQRDFKLGAKCEQVYFLYKTHKQWQEPDDTKQQWIYLSLNRCSQSS